MPETAVKEDDSAFARKDEIRSSGQRDVPSPTLEPMLSAKAREAEFG
jgi:hypothetical protein